MTGGWRYNTINCVRVWRWYAQVGPALAAIAAGACVGAAVLELTPGAAPDLAPPLRHRPAPLADANAFSGPLWAGDIPAYEIDGRRDAPAAGGVAAGGGRLASAAPSSVPSWSPPAWGPSDQTPHSVVTKEASFTPMSTREPVLISEPAALLLLPPPIVVTLACRRRRV